MKTSKLIMAGAALMALAACTTTRENNTEAAAETAEQTVPASTPYSGSIVGEWQLTDIEMSDSLSIKPADIDPEQPMMVMFTDSTYHFQTNCNMVQGEYTRTGDNISFGMGLSTRMACPDMSVEDALGQLLPRLALTSMDNDTTLRVSAENPSAYILLTKVQE